MLLRGAEHPNIVRVLDWGHWPHDKGYLFLVMEQVEGLPLHSWVEETNPSFRELVGVMGTVALTLDWLHARGVLHRDLKPEHILVRAADGQPVLIDFNAADCDGAPTLTTAVLPPGTAHLLSPEAVDFHRLNYGKPGVRYTFRPTDDLYALGVCLFRALTGHYPFPPQLPPDLLALSILTDVPPLISDFNRRAPVALNPVMARLLAKAPGGRYASGRQLHDALVAAASAPGPARAWEERVFAWADAPGGMGSGARRVLMPEWPTLPARLPVRPQELPAVLPAAAPARLERPPLAPQAPVGVHEPPGRRGLRPWWTAAVVSFLVGVVVFLGLKVPGTQWPGVLPWETSQSLGLEGAPRADDKGREVAPAGGTPEAGEATTPPLETSTSAAAAPAAAHGKDIVDVNAPPAASSSSSPKRGRTAPLKKALTAACVGMACSSAPVRPTWPPPPAPEECPEGAVLTMRKELGITVPGKASLATFLGADGQPVFVNVREGPVSFLMRGALGKLPSGTELHGRLYFSERIYGRITEARTPKGATYPVCMEVLNGSEELGLERDKPGDTPESVQVYWAVRLRQVTSFE
jgi:serine/threonine-protein kinase